MSQPNDKMKRVTFTRTVIHETQGRNKGPRYEEGKTYELREDQAERWIKRNAAVEAADDAKVETKAASSVDQPQAGMNTRTGTAARGIQPAAPGARTA